MGGPGSWPFRARLRFRQGQPRQGAQPPRRRNPSSKPPPRRPSRTSSEEGATAGMASISPL
eukprot:5961788-Pyramimonas_sp.AAC.1